MSDTRHREAAKAVKMSDEVKGWLAMLIRQELSPQRAASEMERKYGLSLHHETIYRWVYQDKAEGGTLYTHLRVASKPYRKCCTTGVGK